MPALVTTDSLRSAFPFRIYRDMEDDRLTLSIASASKRLKSWVGEEVYEGAIADDDSEVRKMILKNAEGHLAMHYMILGLQTVLTKQGLVKTEAVAQNNVTNSYFNPSDVMKYQSLYLELAREIAEPYLKSDGTPEDTWGIVEADG